ncbi:MAG: AraC family transcriptional regulator [Cyanobacteria bacterium J06633_2]
MKVCPDYGILDAFRFTSFYGSPLFRFMGHSAEFAHLWTPKFSGLELYRAQLRRHAFDKHFHDAYTIGLNERGLGQSLFQGTLMNTPPGSFNLLNPGEVHTGQAADERGWTFRNIYISAPLMRSLLTQLGHPTHRLPAFRGPNVQNPALRPLFRQVFQTLEQPTPLLTQQSLLMELISQLLRHHGEMNIRMSAKSESQAVRLVQTYLEEHYTENVSIDTLSQLGNLSPYYLIRSFHQQIGLPPHLYQRQVRLLKAKQSLNTCQSLAAIATDAGFFDQSHFTRSFKRVFGLTPGQYRQRNSVQDPSR